MNKIIELLNEKKRKLVIDTASVSVRLMHEYTLIFDKCEIVKKFIIDIENSNDYMQGYDFPDQVLDDAILSSFTLDERPYLMEYLEENNIYYSKDYGYFEYSCGPSIIIGFEGDIYDQDANKWIIDKDEYKTKEKRNELIEKHMENTGHCPCVFESDYNGGLTLISTLKVEK